MKTISVYFRCAYGVTRLYVYEPAMASALSTLTGSKTLEQRHVDALKALGFTLAIAVDPCACDTSVIRL